MSNTFKLLAALIALCLLSIYFLYKAPADKHNNTSSEAQPIITNDVTAYSSDVGVEQFAEQSKVADITQTAVHPIQHIPAVSQSSSWREQLCQQGSDNCILHQNINVSTVLPTKHGDLRAEPAGIIMQSKSFDSVLEQMRTEKDHSDAYIFEDELLAYLTASMRDYPGNMIQAACSQLVCLAEVDVDGETNLQEISELINSNDWPHGSTIIAPVYSGNRLKLRVTTMTRHHPNGGVVY